MKAYLLFLSLVSLSISYVASANTEGYAQSFEVQMDSNTIALTVPSGKVFVLRKLHIDTTYKWEIRKAEIPWLFGQTQISDTKVISLSPDIDFPDNTAIVSSGQVLKLMGNRYTEKTYYTIIGYFRDVQTVSCIEYLDSDINKDCVVNFKDLALIANDWLTSTS